MEKIDDSVSLSEQAYFLLKKAIISGSLEPEKELPEERLAIDLGLSRTPLREAMQRLAMEGLITLNKRKPATVATFTKDESLEFMELRRLLEVYNLEKVVLSENLFFISDLENNLIEQRQAISTEDFQEFIDVDRKFHLILASQSDNNKIKQLIQQVNTGVNRAFLVLTDTGKMGVMDAYNEHTRVVEAIKKKDVDLAKKEMEVHLNNVEERFLISYNKTKIGGC